MAPMMFTTKTYDYFNKIQAGITAGVNVALFKQQ